MKKTLSKILKIIDFKAVNSKTIQVKVNSISNLNKFDHIIDFSKWGYELMVTKILDDSWIELTTCNQYDLPGDLYYLYRKNNKLKIIK